MAPVDRPIDDPRQLKLRSNGSSSSHGFGWSKFLDGAERKIRLNFNLIYELNRKL